jgi:hypothetical protein
MSIIPGLNPRTRGLRKGGCVQLISAGAVSSPENSCWMRGLLSVVSIAPPVRRQGERRLPNLISLRIYAVYDMIARQLAKYCPTT